MIRVLHNIGSLANGGMESFILNLYRYIDTRFVQFDFVVGTSNEWCESYAAEIRLRGGRIFQLYGNSIEQVRQFKTILGQHPEYQIVHSHRDANSVFFLSAAKQMGVKVRIAHSHSASETGKIKQLATILLKPMLNKLATLRLACGIDAGEHLFKGHKYIVFPNAIDLKLYRYCKETNVKKRKDLGLSLDDIVIGHVGRFVDVKNHKFLIEVFLNLQQKVYNAKLLLVGSGPLKHEIINQVLKLGISDKVIMLEHRSDVNELLQAMDIVIFPSKYEGFSMAMVEMQAAGLRILSSDRVPNEINVTGSVTFKSLNESASSWADQLLQLSQYDRNSINADLLVEAGLDVQANAHRLQDMYIELHDSINKH